MPDAKVYALAHAEDSGSTSEKRPGCGCSADGDFTGCYHHDPARKEERTRNARKAATVKAEKEVREIKARLTATAAKVENGELDPAQANAISRLYAEIREYTLLERGIYREQAIARIQGDA